MPYTVVFNVPGQLPEAEPIDSETIQDARDTVLAYIDTAHDVWHEGDCEESAGWYRARDEATKLSEEGGIIRLPDGYIADVIAAS